MSNAALEVTSLSYAYGSYQALQETTFTVNNGEIVRCGHRTGIAHTQRAHGECEQRGFFFGWENSSLWGHG